MNGTMRNAEGALSTASVAPAGSSGRKDRLCRYRFALRLPLRSALAKWSYLPCAGLLLAALAGCGYRAGGPYRAEVRTVYVDMFGSKEFRRDLEFKLTEAVKKRIATDTPYRLAERENADTILMGEVLEERQAALAPDSRSRQPREQVATLAVRVQWKDVRSGRILVEHPVILQSADYLRATGESEHLAEERAIDRLATRIVTLMYEDW